jgi:hypothetical protein
LSNVRLFLPLRLSIREVTTSKMGDWKISCCFCAGPFRGFADFTEEDDDGNEAYNPELLTEQGEFYFLDFRS